MSRSYYIDRIRVVLTALVILHHTAITYGAPGGWYYRELPTTATLTGLLLILFVSVNQAYFMGFFFLLGGYFTPSSYNSKSLGQFALGRVIRLGIPWFVYAILLDPLPNAIADAWGKPPAKAKPFWPGYLHRVLDGDWHSGPLWFAEALLIFSAAYVVWRQCCGKQIREPDAHLPSSLTWFFSALAVGAGALLIRQWFPVGKNIFALQLGYFSSYTFLFFLGTIAWQKNWFSRLSWRQVRGWLILSVVLVPSLVVTAVAMRSLAGQSFNSNGGLALPAILYAFWEPFVAWGVIGAYLVWFREHANAPSAIWEYLGARAYTAYIIHPPVLVAVSVVLRSWAAPALVKFAVTGSLALLATLGLSSLLLLLPGARRVL
jgi:peptidoglycan/LPS O-acetylase OafA/YrhL